MTREENDFTPLLIEKINDPSMRRIDIADIYADAIIYGDKTNWTVVNTAIISRWSNSGLKWIKDAAWKSRMSKSKMAK